MALTLIVPLIGAVLIPLFRAKPNMRETVTLITAGVLFDLVVILADKVLKGGVPSLPPLEVFAGLEIKFEIEPLGMIFALVASTLWIVNSIYSIGYMRGNNEPRQTPFYICFAVAIFATLGIAFAANLFTLFLFYEVLTLSTYPLVTHHGTDKAKAGGRTYLGILVGTSVVFLLPALVFTWHVAGTTDFTPGGILNGKLSGFALGGLLALYMFGIGKAALMPFHRWLPAAMVAPTPVSALLHAVAVVKAGVFSVVKVILYVFGTEHLAAAANTDWLVAVAGFTIVAASVVAFVTDMSVPTIWAYMQDVGGRNTAAVFGWGNMWGNFGAATTPILVPIVLKQWDTNGDWHEAFLLFSLGYLIAGLAALGINANRKIA